jgi:hypothetical protein
MRKILALPFLIAIAFCAQAQGVGSPVNVALQTVNGLTRPIPNATITVCAANTGGIACSPALPSGIFSSSTLSGASALANPFTSDANGNYQFFALPGQYTVTVTSSASPGFAGFSYQVTLSPVTSYGSITMAGGTGSHTFATAYTVIPVCTATDATAANAVKVTATLTAVTVTGTGTDVVNWSCQNAVN